MSSTNLLRIIWLFELPLLRLVMLFGCWGAWAKRGVTWRLVPNRTGTDQLNTGADIQTGSDRPGALMTKPSRRSGAKVLCKKVTLQSQQRYVYGVLKQAALETGKPRKDKGGSKSAIDIDIQLCSWIMAVNPSILGTKSPESKKATRLVC